MKHIIKIFSTVVLVSLLSAGCNRFLDSVNQPEYKTSATFPASRSDVEELLAATYNILSKNLQHFEGSDWMTAMVCSDDCYGGGTAGDLEVQAANQLLCYDVNVHQNFWEICFQGVERANNVIETIDNVDWTGNEARRNQILGEGYFMRGYFMLQLTQMFGDIPLITSTVITHEMIDTRHSAEEEVFPQIFSDFVSGKTLMSAEKTAGHVNKFVAEGMIARAYMFWAGFYKKVEELATASCPAIDLIAQEGCEQASLSKDDVVAGLKDVIANGGYVLCEDYRSLWPYSNYNLWDLCSHEGKEKPWDYRFIADMKRDNCWGNYGDEDASTPPGMDHASSEELFSISCTNLDADFSNSFARYMSMCSQNWEGVWPFSPGGYGWAPASTNIWKDWTIAEEAGRYSDIRKLGSIIDGESDNKELSGYTRGNEGQVEETGYWSKKFCTVGTVLDDGTHFFEFSSLSAFGGPGSDLGMGHSPQNVYILRYADILLMLSELTGDAQYMNQVKLRANLPDQGSYSLTAIQQERRFEFAFEGLRWNDMRRWSGCDKHSRTSYAATALQAQKDSTIYTYGKEEKMKHSTSTWADRYAATKGFRPIPPRELSRHEGWKQNDGWEDADAYYTGAY